MTERFHAAAKKLSSSIPRGQGGILQVQQLFLEAAWWKSEASMVESWHVLSAAIREAQEIGRRILVPLQPFPVGKMCRVLTWGDSRYAQT